MASMTQPTALRPRHLIARHRLTLLLLLVISLAAAIAIVAIQRQAAVPVAQAPAPVAVSYADYDDYFFQVTSGQMLRQPETARAVAVTQASRIIEMYEQLGFQWLAAEQALRARNTEAYEIATAGAEALQSRIATLRAHRPQD